MSVRNAPVQELERAGQCRRRLMSALVSGGLLSLLPQAVCAKLVNTVGQIKPSVVAIGTFQRTRNPSFAFSGTGFVVGNGNLAATNAHVIPDVIDVAAMETLAVAIADGDGNVTVRPARKVAMQKERDLAVLAFDGPALPALRLSSTRPVSEGQEIAFTGYPIGNALGFFPVTHRGIIAAISPIGIPQNRARDLDPALIRRLATDPFRIYQLDATAYPGNSGSPVFDPESGDVVGVINMVFIKSTKERVLSDPSGISYAIPVAYLEALIAGIPR